MADITQSNHSEVDADNNSAAPNGMPEGMNSSGVNNWARAFIGAVKRWYVWSIPKTTTGTSTAYVLTYDVVPTALADGMTHLVQFNATCGASPTLNVNSLGAKPIHKYSGGAWGVCAAGDLTANMVRRVTYNATDGTYRIIQPIGTAANFNVGTSANNVVQLDANGAMPQVAGSEKTGDIIWAFAVSRAGCLPCSGRTIGNAASGATESANANTEALFVNIWNLTPGHANFVIQDSAGNNTTRGASGAADFAANKRMPLPDLRDRAPAGVGTMGSGAAVGRVTSGTSGFDLNAVGNSGGAQANNYGGTTSGGTSGGINANGIAATGQGSSFNYVLGGATVSIPGLAFGGSVTVVQPTYALFAFIKL